MNYPLFWKRILDVILASFMLLLLLPFFLTLLILLALYFRGNPFFFQDRPGRNAALFKIMKFKTMSDSKNQYGDLLSDKLRISKFGKLVRKTSLDEIPQLINVLKGEMSLVGPRPLLKEYLPLYNSTQAKRHQVRPGVTGWAQINGRNAITWEKKFEYDIWYVQHLSLSLDLKILFQTLWNVLRGKGVSQHGHVTVGKFTGSKSPVHKLFHSKKIQ